MSNNKDYTNKSNIDYIIDLLKDNDEGLSFNEIREKVANLRSVSIDDYKYFAQVLEDIVRSGEIVSDKNDNFHLKFGENRKIWDVPYFKFETTDEGEREPIFEIKDYSNFTEELDEAEEEAAELVEDEVSEIEEEVEEETEEVEDAVEKEIEEVEDEYEEETDYDDYDDEYEDD